MTNPKAIGARVHWLRKQANENQQALADVVGVSRSTIGEIERGTERGGLETMVAIADHYGASMDWLLGRRPTRGPLPGEVIDDPDETAWLAFWRGLDDADRVAVLRALSVPPARKAG